MTLVLTIAGVIAGIVALWIALVQITKTRSAAETAKVTSQQTADRLNSLLGIVQIADLARDCEQLRLAIDSGQTALASNKAGDLRRSLFRSRKDPRTKDLLKPKDWQRAIELAVQVHSDCSESSSGNGSEISLSALTASVAEINDLLSEAQGVASQKVEA